MRFMILGPLRVRGNAGEIMLTAARDRTVLATLLLHAGEIVSAPALVEAVWGSQPPENARNQVQGCVSRLRKQLASAGAKGQAIVTDPAGYRVVVDAQDLDLSEFRGLRDEARAAVAVGHAVEASRRYRMALGLWHGSALAGIESALVRRVAIAVDEERLRAIEECLDTELSLGKSGELVPELTELVRQHPYQEKLHGALMLALYRAGRQADALAAYRRLRRLLHDELGAEPGDELQRLHRAVLGRDPELSTPPASPSSSPATATPRELPAPVAAFTGRTQALAELDGLLPGNATPPVPVVISAIAGTAGVGKTALAVHWAHRVVDRFPDGQLYINLRGYAAGAPLRPIDALAALLRSLGTPPEQIPTDEAQAAGLYRSRLAGRQALVVLDNAGSVDQVRPLLPGSAGCLVLVTSRDRLAGLVARDGARRVILDMLTPDESRTLLARLLGTVRVEADLDAVDGLARACAFLPLALRVAAASLVAQPDRPVADYVTELTTGDRLAMLEADGDRESAVRATFDLSYQRIPADAQRMFRLLGLVPGPDFTPAAAAALADTSVEDARSLLARLASAHLLTEHLPGRYAFHDLLRLFASQLARAPERADQRSGAVTRLLGYHLATASLAVSTLYPQMARLPPTVGDLAGLRLTAFNQPADALTWLDAEHTNLVALIVHTAAEGPAPMAWQLTDQLRGYFLRGRHIAEWRTASNVALAVAEESGRPAAHAAIHLNLADLNRSTGEYEKAIEHGIAASEFAKHAGWTDGQAAGLGGIAGVYWWLGRLPQAVERYNEALKLNQKAGRLLGQAGNTLYLGAIDEEWGRLRQAADRTVDALALYRQAGSTVGEADALNSLGTIEHLLGRFKEALAHLRQAMALYLAAQDRGGEADTLYMLAAVYHDTGHFVEASEYARSAMVLAADIGDRRIEAIAHNTMGRVRLHLNRHHHATNHHLRALDLARRAGIRRTEGEALVGLSTAYLCRGQPEAAYHNAQLALDIARDVGYRVLEGQTLHVFAQAHLSRGDHDKAFQDAIRALENHRETGHQIGEARTLAVLGHLQRTTREAERDWRAARELFAAMGAAVPDDLPQVSGAGRG